MIDGDSLLFELLGERSLDWSNGGQFLHLTYLLERFLQYFTDKGKPPYLFATSSGVFRELTQTQRQVERNVNVQEMY